MYYRLVMHGYSNIKESISFVVSINLMDAIPLCDITKSYTDI